MTDFNLIEEYRVFVENARRDNDNFLKVILTLRDVITSLNDTIKNLQDDNKSLRTHLSTIHREIDEASEINMISSYPVQDTFIDIIEEERGVEFPHYSIPPHIRQSYLHNLENQQCSICQENINNNDHTIQLTECGHLFHMNCLQHHRDSDNEANNTCPVCRTNLVM